MESNNKKDIVSDGFTSDYYSLKHDFRHKNLYLRKHTYPKTEIEDHNNNHSDENFKNYKRIFCIPIGYQFDYNSIITGIKNSNTFTKKKDNKPPLPSTPSTKQQIKNCTIITLDKPIYLFDYGVVILWSFTEEEENELCKIIFMHCKYLINERKNKYQENLKEYAYTFYYRKGETFKISNRNKITIESNDTNEILSIVYGLAQHTILF